MTIEYWILGLLVLLTLRSNNVPVPQQLSDLLNSAQTALEAAQAADVVHDKASADLATAQAVEKTSADSALGAHQVANKAASDFVVAAKAYFGLQ
jgi:molybdate-binding protein